MVCTDLKRWWGTAGEGVVLKALRPIGATEFIVAPRQLPAVKDIQLRVDSSLRDGPEVGIRPIAHAHTSLLPLLPPARVSHLRVVCCLALWVVAPAVSSVGALLEHECHPLEGAMTNSISTVQRWS